MSNKFWDINLSKDEDFTCTFETTAAHGDIMKILGLPFTEYHTYYKPGPCLQVGNGIKKVIFNDPATIVLWNDGTKTVVKATGETFDKEKGLAMAICKRMMSNKGNYYNIFRKYC